MPRLSKLAMTGITDLAFLNKSCHLHLACSFVEQVNRLKNARFPQYIITSVAECRLKLVTKGSKHKKGPMMTDIIPYTYACYFPKTKRIGENVPCPHHILHTREVSAP